MSLGFVCLFFWAIENLQGAVMGPKLVKLKLYLVNVFFVYFGVPAGHRIRSAISMINATSEDLFERFLVGVICVRST